MEISEETVHDVTILKLRGELDTTTAPKVMAFINDRIAEGKIKLVANLKEVRYTSSAGLRVLLAAVKETRPRGGDIRLAAVQPDVRKVLNLSGFTVILKLFEDTASAVESFSK